MMSQKPRILVIGFGNPGRLDDGLGPAMIEQLEPLSLSHVTLDSNYQLSVEDAAAVAAHDCVIFVDAAACGPEPFELKQLEPQRAVSFSSHSVQPEVVLGLAQDLFNAETVGYILGIRGYEFNEFKESLSEGARENMSAALDFLIPMLETGHLEAAVGRK